MVTPRLETPEEPGAGAPEDAQHLVNGEGWCWSPEELNPSCRICLASLRPGWLWFNSFRASWFSSFPLFKRGSRPEPALGLFQMLQFGARVVSNLCSCCTRSLLKQPDSGCCKSTSKTLGSQAMLTSRSKETKPPSAPSPVLKTILKRAKQTAYNLYFNTETIQL